MDAGNRRAADESLANRRFQERDPSKLNELTSNSFDLVV
jgi:hypothetical protein